MATQRQESFPPNEREYRVDETTHDLLMDETKPQLLAFSGSSLGLPEPVFPQYPGKIGDVELPSKYIRHAGDNPYNTRANSFVVRRAMRGWLYPYIRSVIQPGDFHPIIAFFFTE